MVLYFLYLGCLFFSFLIGLINLKALKGRQLSILIPYLFLVFVQELGIFIYRETSSRPDAAIIYNIYRPVTVSVFAWLFYYFRMNRFYRRLIPWILSFYLLMVAYFFIFVSSIRDYNRELSLAGGIALTLFGILFLFDYFNLDNATEEKKWSPVLWITAGIVIFYPVVNICFAFYNDIFQKNAMIFGVFLYNAIPQMLSIFMYGTFAFAFYLCKKRY